MFVESALNNSVFRFAPAIGILSLLLLACSFSSDEQTQTEFPGTNQRSSVPTFTAREADLFRTVAFSGAEFNSLDFPPSLPIGHKWERAIFANISGDPDLARLAEEILREVGDVAGILVTTPLSPELANFSIRVGVNGQEHIDNLVEWEFPTTDFEHIGGGAFFLSDNPNNPGSITFGRISTSRSLPDGSLFDRTFVKSTLWEEIVQSFGLLGDFDPDEFSDLSGAKNSIFADDPDRDALEWNELDRRMLTALYDYIPVGSNWDEALRHIRIVD